MEDNNIKFWNQLEGMPYSDDDHSSLEMRIRDPLWMLSRQRVLNEFEAEDNGSLIDVECFYHTEEVTHIYQPVLGSSKKINYTKTPIEKEIEHIQAQKYSVHDAYKAGQLLIEEINNSTLSNKANIVETIKGNENFIIKDEYHYKNQMSILYFKLLEKKKCIDGFKVFNEKISNEKGLTNVINDWKERVKKAIPSIEETSKYWKSDQLEYQFDISFDENGNKYQTKEYSNGHIDWYNFNHKNVNTKFDGDLNNLSLIPTSVKFPGMPYKKTWAFESQKHNFLKLNGEKNELIKLIVSDFMINYSNDWLIFPLKVENGQLTKINYIDVTDVFGDKTTIEYKNSKSSFFDNGEADKELLLLVTSNSKKKNGPILEEILFMRDEVANLVFAIEKRIPNGFSASYLSDKNKSEETQYPVEAKNNKKGNMYKIISSLKENWIPFIVKHDDKNGYRLQRASQLKKGRTKYVKVRPRTLLLREGINNDVTQTQVSPFYIKDEEVPVEGVVVTTRYQRTRWYNGKVVTWLGREKQIGYGKAESDLKFDYLE